MAYLVVTGDKHIRYKEPYLSSVKKVMNWFLASEYNNEDNIYLSLGDETEESINKGFVNDQLISFYRNLKMKKKYIIQGNHDISYDHGSNLDIFNSDDSVEVIKEERIVDFGKAHCLVLPFFHNSSEKNMEDYYSNLPYSDEFDYCFAHIFDETRRFSENQKVCDLSNLKIKQKVFGHDHGFDLDKNGHYLGSIHPNSSTEKDKRPHFYIIDMETGEGKFLELPRFLNYYDVKYPDKLTEFEDEFIILRITDYLDKEEAISYYDKQMKDQGKGFYVRRMERKRLSESLGESESKDSDNSISIKQHLENYFLSKKIDTDVADIIRNTIS